MNSRLFSFVLFFLSLGLFTAASPVEKRATAVMDVINQLQSAVSSAIPSGDLVGRADPSDNINSITAAFASATNTLENLGSGIVLSQSDTNALAQIVANSINNAAQLIAVSPQTASVLTASVLLDLQINLFLNIFAVVVVGIIPIIATLILNLQLLISVHLVIVANIFIDVLGLAIVI